MDITIEIDNEKVRGLLCCAFEGGANYWCQIVEYHLADGVTRADIKQQFDAGNRWHISQLVPFIEGCSVSLRDTETGKSYMLGPQELRSGLSAMARKYDRHFGNFISDHDDAETGDVFLQCCLFGEVVYG